MKVWKARKKKPVELEIPEPPDELRYLLEWHGKMRGREALTFSEIESWCKLMATRLTPFEVEAIRRLDSIYWSIK
jgi:hypothetical protein